MSRHEDDKKEKIRKRNKRNWMIFTQVAEHLKQVDIGAPSDDRKRDERGEKKEEKTWMVMMPQIKNRLNNCHRRSEERWNRYAATSDSGGMGR